MPNASTVWRNRGILWVKGMSNASYSLRDHFPDVSFKTIIMGPARVCRKSVVHLKVDAEIPEVHPREALGGVDPNSGTGACASQAGNSATQLTPQRAATRESA